MSRPHPRSESTASAVTEPTGPPSTGSTAVAAAQALFVAFLWSTSWVLIKIGLADIPALTFAGLRYLLAFAVLLPFALTRPRVRAQLASLTLAGWVRLAALGITMYTLTQGAQFLALAYLPAQTASLVLSFSPVAVALLGAATLQERTTRGQWAGVALYLGGAAVFLFPLPTGGLRLVGLAIAVVGMLCNAAAAILGRSVNRGGVLDPLTVTVASMGVGAVVLFGAGAVTQGVPAIDARGWLIVLALAVVNTAFAFTLWNHTLRTLTVVESSVINNTMLIQIAALAWIFLGESLGIRQIGGLLLAAVGTLLVQLWRRRRIVPPAPPGEAPGR
jgi:drug/metabolite transporter (DMT)-like permease